MQDLDGLVGLKDIKTKVKEYAEYLRFIQLRKDKGFNEPSMPQMHAVFTGNPGTGKTTVAKMLGRIYNKMGLLTKGHVHEVDRADLVGEYIGQTAPKVKEAIKKAKGGILFIDEAYALSRGSRGDYGSEAIETLLKRMEDQNNQFAVIVAGYPEEMKEFVESNPGLKSRFTRTLHFEDMALEDLMAIARFQIADRGYSVTEGAMLHLEGYFKHLLFGKDKFFGNGRVVRNTIEEVIRKQNLRLADLKEGDREAQMKEIELSDIDFLTSDHARRVSGAGKIGFRAK
ncbi:UNVERIFIED_CONTAM: hypothetical protein GTU68_039911 [Idotea baltica]|nr:hypothetical protein [Idotea baltica]